MTGKVAIIHFLSYPHVGGVEEVIRKHSTVLSWDNWDVTVFAGDGQSWSDEIELVVIPELSPFHESSAKVRAQLRRGEITEEYVRLKKEIEDQLRKYLSCFDVVIAHNVLCSDINLPLTDALLSLKEQGVIGRLIGWHHDFIVKFPEELLNSAWPWDFAKRAANLIEHVTISPARQRELVQRFGLPEEKVPVICNGVEILETLGMSTESREMVRLLDLQSADPILITPVRMMPRKNLELAIKVAAELKRRYPRLIWLITGPANFYDAGGYASELQQLKRLLEVDSNVKLIDLEYGPISKSVLPHLYCVSDCLVITSWSEGFGLPILEAGVHGIPIVTTHVPSVEVVGAENLRLVNPDGSPEDIANVICGELEGALVRFKRRVRREFSWKNIYRNHIRALLLESESEIGALGEAI